MDMVKFTFINHPHGREYATTVPKEWVDGGCSQRQILSLIKAGAEVGEDEMVKKWKLLKKKLCGVKYCVCEMR
jgi:hypothetical protein